MPERSIIYAQGCEQNINNWIFFFLLENLEYELVGLKNRSTIESARTVTTVDSGPCDRRTRAKNLAGGNVEADSAPRLIIEEFALLLRWHLARKKKGIADAERRGPARRAPFSRARPRRSPWNGKKERRPRDVTRLARRCR